MSMNRKFWILISIFALIALEGFARLSMAWTSAEVYPRYGKVQAGESRSFLVNEVGAKGDLHFGNKREIAVLGGSVAFGWRIPSGEAWPELMVKDRRISLDNFSIRRLDFRGLNKIFDFFEARKLHYRLLLLEFPWSDRRLREYKLPPSLYSDDWLVEPILGLYFPALAAKKIRAYIKEDPILGFWLIRASIIDEDQLISQRREYEASLKDGTLLLKREKVPEKNAEDYRNRVRATLLRAKTFGEVVVLLPLIQHRQGLTCRPLDLWNPVPAETPGEYLDIQSVAELVRSSNALVQSVAQELGLKVISQDSFVESHLCEPGFLMDQIHFGVAGHKAFAAMLVESLGL